MSDKHGGKIGRYQLIAPIGSGGFATVYRAIDERLGSEVALKVLAENHSLVPDYRERFISEAQHLRRVDSYWVASIFDLGETDSGQPYMVLELADRGDLETRVNDLWDHRLAVKEDDLLVLADTLAHSLAAIHAADLIHRDVTPGNILVRHNGLKPEPWSGRKLLDRGERLLLSDLGYAKDLRAASGITSGGGTAGFAAPEQHGEVTQVDARADVFGATAVLKWAATGSKYEHALSDVIGTGMADDPADRYQDMSAWRADVQHALTGPSSPAAISSGMIEDGGPPWTRTAVVVVAAMSLAFVISALFWFDWRGSGEPEPTTVPPAVTESPVSTSSPLTLPSPTDAESGAPITPEGPRPPPTGPGVPQLSESTTSRP